MTNSSIRLLTASDIPQVVALHRKVLGSTLNAQVGSEYLAGLYQIVLKDTRNSAGWVTTAEDETITGFLTVTRNLFDLERRIHAEIGIKAQCMVAWHLLIHPAKIAYLFARSNFSRYLQQLSPHQHPTILTIGINHNIQKQGLGTRLIATSDSYFASHNTHRYFVDTEATNRQACDFYAKRGFNKIGECEGNILFEKEFR